MRDNLKKRIVELRLIVDDLKSAQDDYIRLEAEKVHHCIDAFIGGQTKLIDFKQEVDKIFQRVRRHAFSTTIQNKDIVLRSFDKLRKYVKEPLGTPGPRGPDNGAKNLKHYIDFSGENFEILRGPHGENGGVND